MRGATMVRTVRVRGLTDARVDKSQFVSFFYPRPSRCCNVCACCVVIEHVPKMRRFLCFLFVAYRPVSIGGSGGQGPAEISGAG